MCYLADVTLEHRRLLLLAVPCCDRQLALVQFGLEVHGEVVRRSKRLVAGDAATGRGLKRIVL